MGIPWKITITEVNEVKQQQREKEELRINLQTIYAKQSSNMPLEHGRSTGQ